MSEDKINHLEKYCDLMRKLHAYQIGEKNEYNDPEIEKKCEDLRDVMDVHWYKMTEEEIEISDKLSDDLWREWEELKLKKT